MNQHYTFGKHRITVVSLVMLLLVLAVQDLLGTSACPAKLGLLYLLELHSAGRIA